MHQQGQLQGVPHVTFEEMLLIQNCFEVEEVYEQVSLQSTVYVHYLPYNPYHSSLLKQGFTSE
jgi:hypothetical protein